MTRVVREAFERVSRSDRHDGIQRSGGIEKGMEEWQRKDCANYVSIDDSTKAGYSVVLVIRMRAVLAMTW